MSMTPWLVLGDVALVGVVVPHALSLLSKAVNVRKQKAVNIFFGRAFPSPEDPDWEDLAKTVRLSTHSLHPAFKNGNVIVAEHGSASSLHYVYLKEDENNYILIDKTIAADKYYKAIYESIKKHLEQKQQAIVEAAMDTLL